MKAPKRRWQVVQVSPILVWFRSGLCKCIELWDTAQDWRHLYDGDRCSEPKSKLGNRALIM